MKNIKLRLAISAITMMIISVIIILATHNNDIKLPDSDSNSECITTTGIETNNQSETTKKTGIGEEKRTAILNYTSTEQIASNEYYKTELAYVQATLDNAIAYSLDYNLNLPCDSGAELSQIRVLSGITTAGLVFGYPNVSPDELGVESNEEARMATQFAVWRLAKATGVDDAKDSEYIFDMDNLWAYEGHENYITRVKAVAQKIVDNALKEPCFSNPTINIDSESVKLKLVENKFMIVGPYIIDGKGYNITNIDVMLEDAPESAVLCDADGNARLKFENGDSIYIKMAQTENGKQFTLRIETEGNHSAGIIYGTGKDNDAKQNFCVLENFEDRLTVLTEIKLPLLTGGINVKITDQYETAQSGVKVQLKDTLGNELEIVETDENGCALFDNLPIGEYVIVQLGEDDKYIFMDMPVQSEVEYNKVNDLTIKNTLIE